MQECDLLATTPFVAAHQLRAALPGETSATATVVFRTAPAVTIGAARVERPSIGLSLATAPGILTTRAVDGYIGGRLLRHYRVTFDYRAHRMWLDPP